jgi:hypothetical protein
LLGLVAALWVNSALGQMIRFRSNEAADNSTSVAAVADGGSTPFVPEKSAGVIPPAGTNDDVPCGNCEGLGCGCGCCKADCDECPGIGIEVLTGVQCWRSVADSDLQNNFGPMVSANVGVPIPGLREYGIGAQVGFSYAAADLDGRENFFTGADDSDVQQQTFFTAGLFRRAFDGDHWTSRFSLGIAYDWMVNDAYGVMAQSPFLGQWRGQIGYCLSAQNEIGIWGTLRDRGDERFDPYGDPIVYRPLSQIDLFWHHTFCSGANCWLSVGMPEHLHTAIHENLIADQQLGQSPLATSVNDGSLGEFTLGATFIVPISQRWALYANASYMRPTAAPGAGAAVEDAYSVGFGLTFYPGGNARTRTVAGNCWMPYLPVANNGTFLVDSPTVY